MALQPLAGFPLAIAIGARLDEYWIEVSVAIYAAVVAAWLANLIIELRIRKVTQEAALDAKPLPDSYRRLFRMWSVNHGCGPCRHDRHHGADDLATASVLKLRDRNPAAHRPLFNAAGTRRVLR